MAATTPSAKEFEEVLQRIRQTRQRVFAQANTALIELYWQIGQTISDKVDRSGWGNGVVSELARYIARTAPEIKGFSDKNLWRMKQFYETYRDSPKLAPLVRELPWTHNTLIFSRCKTPEEREYYLRLATIEKLTKRELERQIDSAHFERSLAAAKLSPVARELHPAADIVFRDSYVLEFLGLPETEVVEYALSRHLSPTLIAQYQLQLPDKKLLQAKLHELFEHARGEES